jgi:hypothetical protein
MPVIEKCKNIWRGKRDRSPERANRNNENGGEILALQLGATRSSQNFSNKHPDYTALRLSYCRKNLRSRTAYNAFHNPYGNVRK